MIRKEYEPDTSIFRDEGLAQQLMVRLWRLEEHEINLFILYTEIPSYRKVGEILGVSYGTVKNEMDKIRRKLK
ncbi:MAG: hypothetical protein LUG98_05400 [Tannerellaceae bacterium]|nr:hypothetical protein [Tannerellaceae bacterium]